MLKSIRNSAFAAILVLLFLAVILGQSLTTVKAQDQANVTILVPLGGTITPPAGDHTYPSGTQVQLSATSDSSFFFTDWYIQNDTGVSSTQDNPYTLTVAGGENYTILAVFSPLSQGLDYSDQSKMPTDTVVMLPSVGGTTTPAPGAYPLATATFTQLTATPDSGWKFDHWVIGGGYNGPLSHGGYAFTDTPTDNPYTVGHQGSYTYSYQAVFSPVSSSSSSPSSSPTTPEFSAAATALLAIVLVAGIVAALTFSKRSRK